MGWHLNPMVPSFPSCLYGGERIKLLDIMQMDISAYILLLPRITTPMLSESQINNLDLADLVQVMVGVQGFLLIADSQET